MEQTFSLRALIGLSLVGIVASSIYWGYSYLSSDTKIIFCDIGQGDGAYLRIKNKVDVLIDAGPDSSILECLSQNMPQFDKTIEYAFITHPQVDHYGGLISVLKQYRVQTIYSTGIGSPSKTYEKLEVLAHKQQTKIKSFTPGVKIVIENAVLSQIWPSGEYINEISNKAQNEDVLTKRYSSGDPNQTSEILRFNQGDLSVLYTGDVSPDSVHRMILAAGCTSKSILLSTCAFNRSITVLKVPHHGSKNNLSVELLDTIRPKFAVISAGRNNRFGHPHKEILRLLNDKHIKTYVTAQVGSIILSEHNAVWTTSFQTH